MKIAQNANAEWCGKLLPRCGIVQRDGTPPPLRFVLVETTVV